ncbi:hypothetical protein CIG75_01310 [Tumebacillus algifaecis]|uniref:Uncharacterized protein n=1 Tax=Tumebacillus algifaecis TaxID=1214604 RepID=A0A223CXB1_9BACL|nr:hypothetical protein [Tumebacillus algifaecis]ASS73743.1 hypothetical protein CIG75_01310 [Tumebacillus algifaecis]
MAKLEYRLLDEEQEFPVLYSYASVEKQEILLRFACDYFVKERTIYSKTSTALEGDLHVIYVELAYDEHIVDSTLHPLAHQAGIRLELREYKDDTVIYPLIHTYEFKSADDVLLMLTSNYLYLGGREWERSSTEVDEDRQVYVYYATPTAWKGDQ